MCISVKLYSHSMYTPGYFWYHHIQKILWDRGSCIRVYIHIKQRRVIFFFLLFSSELISSTYLNNLLLPILIAGSQRLWINLPMLSSASSSSQWHTVSILPAQSLMSSVSVDFFFCSPSVSCHWCISPGYKCRVSGTWWHGQSINFSLPFHNQLLLCSHFIYDRLICFIQYYVQCPSGVYSVKRHQFINFNGLQCSKFCSHTVQVATLASSRAST